MYKLGNKLYFILASDSDTSAESISRMQQKFGVALLLHDLASQVYHKTRTVLRYESVPRFVPGLFVIVRKCLNNAANICHYEGNLTWVFRISVYTNNSCRLN
jgi:hypothetical protein